MFFEQTTILVIFLNNNYFIRNIILIEKKTTTAILYNLLEGCSSAFMDDPLHLPRWARGEMTNGPRWDWARASVA